MTESATTRARLESRIDSLLATARGRGRLTSFERQELTRIQLELSQLAKQDLARRLAS